MITYKELRKDILKVKKHIESRTRRTPSNFMIISGKNQFDAYKKFGIIKTDKTFEEYFKIEEK